jgi:hypothetical protein
MPNKPKKKARKYPALKKSSRAKSKRSLGRIKRRTLPLWLLEPLREDDEDLSAFKFVPQSEKPLSATEAVLVGLTLWLETSSSALEPASPWRINSLLTMLAGESR